MGRDFKVVSVIVVDGFEDEADKIRALVDKLIAIEREPMLLT